MTKLKSKATVPKLLAVTMLILGAFQASAQPILDNVAVRFASPQFSAEEQMYSVDIEMRSAEPGQELFGINLRFFYDASDIDFEGISSLNPSYGVMGPTPSAHRGNEESGQVLFNFPGPAGFVNTAIQLMNESQPLAISTNGWTKLATLNFSFVETFEPSEKLCPSLIWDQKTAAVKESYLAGSGGVIITLVEHQPSTRETTKPSTVLTEPFNWERNAMAVEGPFGDPMGTWCIEGAVTSSAQDAQFDPRFGLYQNYPNPFTGATIIEFDLPRAKQAALVLTDANGRILHIIRGDFAEGRNQVSVDRTDLSVNDGAVVFYRLESGDFISKALKMIVSGQ